MNEFWQSESGTSFCFCFDGEWFQADSDALRSEWHFREVVMDRGLPVAMHEDLYQEIDLQTMLGILPWTEEELRSQMKSHVGNSGDPVAYPAPE